ncbi:MAG: hypothetical protein NWE95_06170 [Candidatus Bathyarchaeota archaeon]|jgi:hypothetical protein|nr:hypothetical protein [Candidatus Bathyarchaeota archaeon]
MKRSGTKSGSAEPYFYIALVLKGSEKQYLNLLKYVNGRNGAQVIYQCKSLTYLRVTRDSGSKRKTVRDMPSIELEMQEAETA